MESDSQKAAIPHGGDLVNNTQLVIAVNHVTHHGPGRIRPTGYDLPTVSIGAGIPECPRLRREQRKILKQSFGLEILGVMSSCSKSLRWFARYPSFLALVGPPYPKHVLRFR